MLGTSLARAQEFGESQRVTSIDLSVELRRGAFASWLAGEDQPAPRAEDFEVVYAGSRQAVVEVAPAASEDSQGRRVVLYFDLRLSTEIGARQVATALGERADRLVDLGEVEIVVADPEVRPLLAPTRDAEKLAAALAALASDPGALDALGALRSEAFEARDSDEVAGLLAELGAAAADSEKQIVGEQLDRLLLELTTDLEPARRRVLFLVSEGFDLEPEAFYDQSLGLETPRAAGAAPDLSDSAHVAGQVLAAYGWVVFGVSPPPPRGPEKGLRVGRWLVSLAGPHAEEVGDDETYPDIGGSRSRTPRIFLGGVRASLQEHRKPERARAYLELGIAREGQGKLPESEDALRKALYHFADDPKTAASQAEALAALAVVLEKQGEGQKARAAASRLLEAYGEFVTFERPDLPILLAPLVSLETISGETSGRLVRGPEALDEAFGELGRRLRLTFQVEGRGDGELHPVEVSFSGSGAEALAPAWARHSTPDHVAAIRARRLLAGELELERSGLPFSASMVLLAGERARVEVDAPWPRGEAESAGLEPNLRLTLASLAPDLAATRILHLQSRQAAEPRQVRWRAELEVARQAPYVAVVVEDLDRGTWSAKLLSAGGH